MKNLGRQAFHEFSKWDQYRANMMAASSVDSRDVKLHYLYNLVKSDPSPENYAAIKEELTHRQNVDNIFHSVFEKHMEAVKNKTTPRPVTDDDFACYKDLINAYNTHCGRAEDYTFKYFGAFVAECQSLQFYPEMMEVVQNKIKTQCAINKTSE